MVENYIAVRKLDTEGTSELIPEDLLSASGQVVVENTFKKKVVKNMSKKFIFQERKMECVKFVVSDLNKMIFL